MQQSKLQEQKETSVLYTAQAKSKRGYYLTTRLPSLNTQEQLLTTSMEETAFASINSYEKDLSPTLNAS